jgi:hypothetical protein
LAGAVSYRRKGIPSFVNFVGKGNSDRNGYRQGGHYNKETQQEATNKYERSSGNIAITGSNAFLNRFA